MSITWNPTRSRLFGAQTDLKRLLLLCRFDFRQKTWGLPAVEIRRDLSSDLSADSFALAAAIGKKHPEFST